MFALDESGSMNGKPWNDLKQALTETMNKITAHSKKGGDVHVTIINFSDSARIIY